MKTIKTFLLAGLAAVLLTTPISCTDYQDEIDALDVRVTYLESLVNQVNNNLGSLSKIVKAMDEGDYIKDVGNIPGGQAGYRITFWKNGYIDILDGADGKEPNIGIAKDPISGDWCWTIEGNFIEVNGQYIRANGNDAVQPLVKILDNVWVYSLDGGLTWIPIPGGGPVKGNDGEPGSRVVTGYTVSGDGSGAVLILYLNDGTTVIKIPVLEIKQQ